MKKRLRYAPSPTGNLHIGGARTALFNYLFAKNVGGEFIFRTEDTDIERNVKNGEKNQIQNLKWLGITIDEDPIKGGNYGPYRQTERLEIYNKYIDKLLEKKIAYKCWCSTEELEKQKQKQIFSGVASPKYSGKCFFNQNNKDKKFFSVRIRIPIDKNFVWNDGVRGKISFPGKDIGDWVIKKTNGIPTYNFAVVIDDHLMGITDILRGEEHISNTPKQIHLFESLGWEIPNFFHLSIIIGKNKKKLSKRDEKTLQFIHIYKERGYLPEAIFNFLSLLGWSPKGEKEIFTKKELIKLFDKNRLSKAPSFFDINKLLWTNNYYIKKLSDDNLNKFLSPFVEKADLSQDQKMEIFKTFQPQLKEGIEIRELANLFIEKYTITSKSKLLVLENKEIIIEFSKKIQTLEVWDQFLIKELLMDVGTFLKLKGKELMMPIRLAITGKEYGPDITGIIKIFGKKKTISRLEEFINEN